MTHHERTSVQVTAPRFEHLDEPLGIGVSTPRVSWKTQAESGWRQAGWQLSLTREDGQTVVATGNGPDQVLVAWPFEPLRSRERAEVRVRVRGADGAWSSWGPATAVEAGLLDASEWVATPVGAAWPEEPDTERRPSLVRRSFVVTSPVRSARLYVTAHGLYEAEINGRRVGDHELSPGWTKYDERLTYWTFDVTEHIVRGENVIGAWLGDGWYRGRLGFNGGYRDLYGTDLSLIAQLELSHEDGSRTVVATDREWEAARGPILVSGLYDGEKYDMRDEVDGWSSPGASTGEWAPVRVGERDAATLVAPVAPPVRVTEDIRPVSIARHGEGFLVDFGQNLVGRLRLRVDGPAGQVVELRHAEVLEHGELGTRPLRLADAQDVVVLDGRGPREWEPRFTFHGFRYATIVGLESLTAEDVVARVLHNDMRRTGWFETSSTDLNRLHENVRWGMRGNFVSVPTDCPQRDERLGWTGDIQVFAPTASFLYDSAGFLESWLADVALEQLPDGTIPWFVPVIPGGPSWTPIRTGAVWGDVSVLTPWTLYERFGDRGILERQYVSGRAWVERMVRESGQRRLWQQGHQLGDWLDPAAPPEDPAAGLTDKYLVASAYFAFTTRRLADTALLLGHAGDAIRYARIADEARDAFRSEYVLPDGRLTSDAQTAYALAIRFGLLSAAETERAGERLAELVAESGNHIATGFAGTPVVTDALTQVGEIDRAYALLLEDTCPSWMYAVRMGGTTIWERWDSMLPDGSINPGEMTSFNHYALGSVADWMHRVIGGLTPTGPGYRSVRWAPRVGGGLTSARVAFDSAYGLIEASWRVTDEGVAYEIRVPTGVEATVDLPGLESVPVESGGRFAAVVPVPVALASEVPAAV
ncbi:alpha-L-rhamnosidase [Microbacterium oryzae]|uniref:alpha-L-rhamnosidase n=1 Tax=Microbacterium oryzae TaxID=743009 RepID=UPI0015649A87|nr:alpha-L-rhamnosidase [Microbacterium oryzae]